MDDASAVAGLLGDLGAWSGDLRFAFGAANWINPVDAAAFWTNAIDTRTRGFDAVAS